MRRATAVRPAGTWPANAAVGRVILRYDDRYRRRLRLTDDGGNAFLLDLERATLLRDGDGLELEGGGVLEVAAAAEPVLEVRPASPAAAARLAWHLGNRHTAVQICADGTLRLRDDHVLAAMLERLGAAVARVEAPFQPEAGAYAGPAGPEDGRK